MTTRLAAHYAAWQQGRRDGSFVQHLTPGEISQWLGLAVTVFGIVGAVWLWLKRAAVRRWWLSGRLSLSQPMIDAQQVRLDASQQLALDNMERAMRALQTQLTILESNLAAQTTKCEADLAILRSQLADAIAAKDLELRTQEAHSAGLEEKMVALTADVRQARDDLALAAQKMLHPGGSP